MNIFDPNLHLKTVTVVGLGGTGAQIARHVARIVYDMKVRRVHTPHLTIIDPDIVSTGNLGRQLFEPRTVGEPKARVLARRFGIALGLEITSIVAPLDAKKHIEMPHSTLVIGAVDNAAARRSIAAAQTLTIDCGNAHTTAQVSIGNVHESKQLRAWLTPEADGAYHHLPSPYLVFPELLIDEAATAPDAGLSCAQLIERDTQHLLINDLVSCAASAYVFKLLHRQPIQSWISFVSIDGPTMRQIEVSPQTVEYYGHIKPAKTKAA